MTDSASNLRQIQNLIANSVYVYNGLTFQNVWHSEDVDGAWQVQQLAALPEQMSLVRGNQCIAVQPIQTPQHVLQRWKTIFC